MPTRALTETFARYVKVDSRQYFWDSRIPGFGLRVSSPRRGGAGKTWVLRYTPKGERVKRELKLGPHPALSASDARSRAHALYLDVLGGADPKQADIARRDAIRVSDLCQRFLDEHCPRLAEKSQKTYRDKIKNHILHPSYGLGDLRVCDVRREHVQRFIDHVAQRKNRNGIRCVGQATKVKGLVSSIFSFAEFVGAREPNTSPTKGVRIDRRRQEWELDKVEAIGHVFEEDEAWETWRVLGEVKMQEAARDCLRLIALTGVRKDEARLLKWSDIILGGRHPHLQIRRHKTSARQPIKEVPLVETAIALLRRWGPGAPDAWVFPSPVDAAKAIGDIGTPWARVRKAAGVPKARIHDLRGLAACTLVDAGWTEQQIMSFMAWNSPAMVRRYVQSSRGTLRRGAEIIELGVAGNG